MKINELVDLLTRAEYVKSYFEDYLKDSPGASFETKCTMPKPRVEEVAQVIDELIKFIEDRDI